MKSKNTRYILGAGIYIFGILLSSYVFANLECKFFYGYTICAIVIGVCLGIIGGIGLKIS